MSLGRFVLTRRFASLQNSPVICEAMLGNGSIWNFEIDALGFGPAPDVPRLRKCLELRAHDARRVG